MQFIIEAIEAVYNAVVPHLVEAVSPHDDLTSWQMLEQKLTALHVIELQCEVWPIYSIHWYTMQDGFSAFLLHI